MSSLEMENIWREAKVLAQSKAVAEVFNRIEQRIRNDWANSDPEQYEQREAGFHLIRAVRTFRDELAALAAEPDVTAFNRRLKGDK